MAGPQLEDGYTQIANKILEETARHKFNGTQYSILLVVWRYTYGFKRKSHELSIGFIAEAINAADPKGVKRELNNLLLRNVLLAANEAQGSRPRSIGFNKNFSQWLDEVPLQEKPADPSDPEKEGRKKKTMEKLKFHDTVFLTQEQYDKLCTDFGKTKVDNMIEALDEWQTNKKKSQHKKDHNKTIRVWIKRDQAKAPVKTKQQRNQEEQDILNQFYEEGAAREANRDSQLFISNQNGVSLF